MSNKDPNNSEKEEKAEEPETAFKTVRFFDSFEEMDRFEYRQYAKMSPEERLLTVLKIRNRVWPEESYTQSGNRHVHFKDDGNNI